MADTAGSDRAAGKQKLTRRALIGGGAAAILLGLTACEIPGVNESNATPTPKLPPTAAITPSPTQSTIASPVPGYLDKNRWKGRTLTVASWGSDYQDAQSHAFFEPFAKATGADVQQKTADVNRLKKQVDGSAVSWDVVDVPTEDVLPLSRANYLTAIDFKVVDRTALFDSVVMQYGVGVGFYSTVICYPVGATAAPGGWADFWNVQKFPGVRALDGRAPEGSLEFALLADGVGIDDLYPLDIERAFASLDKIKPNVAVWYEDGKQPTELVASAQVALASTWNVRADAPDVQNKVKLQWNGGMLAADSWVIPRGSANVDVAMDFVNFATRAVPSANFSRLFPFGPVHKNAFPLLTPERVAILPNAEPNRAVQFVQGWNWWADNREEVTARFKDWLLIKPKKGTPTASS